MKYAEYLFVPNSRKTTFFVRKCANKHKQIRQSFQSSLSFPFIFTIFRSQLICFFADFSRIFFGRFQVRGHQRGGSTDTREFHEVTKRDALTHFDQELNALLSTIPNDEAQDQYAKEMKRFSALFGRFLQEEGPSVEWGRIQKLPPDAVKDYATLSLPTEKETVNICDFCTFLN